MKRETPEQRAERLRKQEEENTSLVWDLPKAFDFQFVGEDVVNGRWAYVLQATPRPGYHAQGKYGNMFSKVAGKLWVDKQDIGWIQTRVDDGIWMPEHVEVRAAAKILFVKSLIVERVLTYSEYRLLQAGVTTKGEPVIPRAPGLPDNSQKLQ